MSAYYLTNLDESRVEFFFVFFFIANPNDKAKAVIEEIEEIKREEIKREQAFLEAQKHHFRRSRSKSPRKTIKIIYDTCRCLSNVSR